MISVIVPIYNAEKYLQRTFICLQNQSISDFEVILMDDGSIDGSAQLCKIISESDHRFKYYYQANKGVSAARNSAMSWARGEYITFIDADDEIPNNYLEELLSTLIASNSEVAVCDVSIIRDKKQIGRFSCKDNKLNRNDAINLLLSRKNINSGPCAKLFTRTALNGIRFPMLKAYEDIVFVLQVFDRCDLIAFTSETEYKYYQNDDSAMSAFNHAPSFDIIVATEIIMDYLETKKELDGLCVYTTMSHLMQYVQPLVGKKDNGAKSFVHRARKIFKKYHKKIMYCNGFPWKEKIAFIMFALGINYTNRKFSIVR